MKVYIIIMVREIITSHGWKNTGETVIDCVFKDEMDAIKYVDEQNARYDNVYNHNHRLVFRFSPRDVR